MLEQLRNDWNELDIYMKATVIFFAPIFLGVYFMLIFMVWGTLFGVF